MPYIGKSPSFGVRNRFVYVADADDTSVSGADANGATPGTCTARTSSADMLPAAGRLHAFLPATATATATTKMTTS